MLVPAGDADDLAAELGVELDGVLRRRCRSPGRRPRSSRWRMPSSLRASRTRVDEAVAGGLGPAERTAHAHGLAGDEAGVLAAADDLEFIEHPQHVLGVGHDVGGGDVAAAGRRSSRSGGSSRGRCAPAPGRLRSCGSQMTPPLPPPSGMSTTEHFQVIHMDRARTVSIVSWGWKRMPPLQGPRASLCWQRKPRKTLDAAVVHPDGDREMVFSEGLPEQFPCRLIKFEKVRDAVELLLGHLERIEPLGCHEETPF